MNDRRHFSRLHLNTYQVEVEFNNIIKPAKVVDLSLKGVLLNIEDKFEDLSGLCTIRIALIPSEIKMVFTAKLVYQKEDKFGFEFEEEDLESLIHLRRLLELNSPDPEHIIEELFFLVHRDN
jgi:PilZ domain